MIDLKGNPFFWDDAAIMWVHKTLAEMTIEEKAGQLFCLLVKRGEPEELDAIYRILQPGGCMYRTIPTEKAIEVANRLRANAKIPLLVAANLEKGGNGIVSEGTLVGSPMEIAATDDTGMAEKLGIVCAEESRRVGANWAFAPIIDIDSNFRNPITNTRTFGSDPVRVKAMGLAYLKAVQTRGLAASIKHFPGDGQDERDQHLVTSINSMSCEEWDASYGKVYQACIDAGALTCMVGHIMQPAYSRRLNPELRDEEILPGSLSLELMQGLLRGKLGFNGMIVTDATTMAGYTLAMSRRKAVPASIAAGADMFLFTRNLEEDYRFMLDGIKNGVITTHRLDEAVTRILAVKAALGLHKGQEPLSLEDARRIIGCHKHMSWAEECAEKAVTLIKEQPGVLPLTTEKYKRILFYPLESTGGFSQYSVKESSREFEELLRADGFEVDEFQASAATEGELAGYEEVLNRYDLIIYFANLATRSNQTAVRIEWAQPMGANCAHYMQDIPTIMISVENPYHLLDFPRVRTYINGYSNNSMVLNAVWKKLTGRSAFTGKSPVDPFCGKWDTHLQ